MSEVKSAKQIGRDIVVWYGQHGCDYLNIPDMTKLILSDRRAIIEKCKEAIENMKAPGGQGVPILDQMNFTYDNAIHSLDSVLSDLKKEE
jgi:hypothetical protein